MEIELTSRREDGAFTWRAAGAREPRGVIDGARLGGDAKVGDVLRVEAEVELEGLTITAVVPNRPKNVATNRIEIIVPKTPVPGVTTSLVEKRERRSGGRGGADRESGRPRSGAGGPRRDGDARPPREGAPGRRRSPENTERPGRPPRPADAGSPTQGRPSSAPRPRAGAPTHTRPRPPRFVENTVHRSALFATLPSEHRPIAEQLAIGGLPAVRRAVAEEQGAARAAGRPVVEEAGILAIAEALLPQVREAVWLDRAEAAVAKLETISLRDLRAAVVGAAPRDDRARDLLRQLREAYDARLAKLRATWAEDISRALAEGRVLQALRLSSRLPEPSARFPAALVEPLATAASAALAPDAPPDRWTALLEAAANAPVRRIIKPAGLPGGDPAVRQAASAAAGRIPALAALLGLPMPPPPGPPGRKDPAPRRTPRSRPAGEPPAPAPIPPPPAGAFRNQQVAVTESAARPPLDVPGLPATSPPPPSPTASDASIGTATETDLADERALEVSLEDVAPSTGAAPDDATASTDSALPAVNGAAEHPEVGSESAPRADGVHERDDDSPDDRDADEPLQQPVGEVDPL